MSRTRVFGDRVESSSPGCNTRPGPAAAVTVQPPTSQALNTGVRQQTTFFLGRETLLATKRPGMALCRERLFALLSRNARRATHYFRLPPSRVCELGAEIEL